MDGFALWVYGWASLAFAVALLLAMFRLLWGPNLADRVVALDLVAYLLIAFTALYAIVTGHYSLLSVALAIGLFVFLGTIAFARYMERAIRGKEPPS